MLVGQGGGPSGAGAAAAGEARGGGGAAASTARPLSVAQRLQHLASGALFRQQRAQRARMTQQRSQQKQRQLPSGQQPQQLPSEQQPQQLPSEQQLQQLPSEQQQQQQLGGEVASDTMEQAPADEDDDEDAAGPVPLAAAAALLSALTWAVFAAQWLPVLPQLLAMLGGGRPLEALQQLLLVYPDTATTRLLQLDVAAVLHGQQLQGLFTASLLHSGLLSALCCTDALADAGTWLEVTSGPLVLLVTFCMASAGAAAAQLLLGSTATAICGAGAVTGLYAALALAGVTERRGLVPVTTWRGLLYTAVNLAVAALQPALGPACLAGGALGGALAVPLAPTLARGVALSLGLPVLLALGATKIAWQLALALLVAGAAFVMATVRAVGEVVQTIRNL